jgi:hypothetical protein
VTGLPTTLILNGNVEVVLIQTGYLLPKDYLKLLDRDVWKSVLDYPPE